MRIRFHTDQEQDTSTGLYNFNARLYDPVIGTFVSADTTVSDSLDPQNLNRFAYCRNNPLIYTDPSGHLFLIDDAIMYGYDYFTGQTNQGFFQGTANNFVNSWSTVGNATANTASSSWNYFTVGKYQTTTALHIQRDQKVDYLKNNGRSGDVIFAQSNSNPISLMIEAFTRTPVSHTAMYQGNGKISETSKVSSPAVSIDNFASRYVDIEIVRPNSGGAYAAKWQAQAFQSKNPPTYNYWGLLGMWNQTGEHGYICSEFVWHAFEESGNPLPKVNRDLQVSPADLYNSKNDWGQHIQRQNGGQYGP